MLRFFLIKITRPDYLGAKLWGLSGTILIGIVVHSLIAAKEFGYFYRGAIAWVVGCAVGAFITTVIQYFHTIRFYLMESEQEKMSSEKFQASMVLLGMLLVALALIVAFFVKCTDEPISKDLPYWIFFWANLSMAVFAFLVVFVDYHLFAGHPERDNLVLLDGAVLLCVLITNAIYFSYDYFFPDFFNFAVGYKAGAITFEIMLACLLFDPPLPRKGHIR